MVSELRFRIRLVLAVCAVLLGASACNMIDIAIGRNGKLSDMVPGQSVVSDELSCWLTLEFNQLPEGVDPSDVRVRFTSIALQGGTQEFDWEWIAAHDFEVIEGGAFGSGNRPNRATMPNDSPPIGQRLKARFPLRSKSRIDSAPDTLWLTAELYWGGKKQDSTKRTIEHVYASTPGGFL